MNGLDEFLNLFGNITILQIVQVGLAGVFMFYTYIKIRNYLIDKHEAEKQRDAQIHEALSAVRKYPEYRQQSIQIQKLLEGEIQELQEAQKENAKLLMQIEDQNKRRERNKIRDRLLQSYRYYTNEELNPSKSWTRMEAEAFWEMFKDYEEADGDGYIHSIVQPAMQRLIITEMDV